MMAKAAGLDLDHVFLDLEDAVAPSAKPAARGMIVDALNDLDWKPRTCVRAHQRRRDAVVSRRHHRSRHRRRREDSIRSC